MRLRPGMVEARHSGECNFQRNRDVSLDVLRAQSLRLGDDFHQRRHRIRIGLDVQPVKRDYPQSDDAYGQYPDGRRVRQCETNDSFNHESFKRGFDCERGTSARGMVPETTEKTNMLS